LRSPSDILNFTEAYQSPHNLSKALLKEITSSGGSSHEVFHWVEDWYYLPPIGQINGKWRASSKFSQKRFLFGAYSPLLFPENLPNPLNSPYHRLMHNHWNQPRLNIGYSPAEEKGSALLGVSSVVSSCSSSNKDSLCSVSLSRLGYSTGYLLH
jgi:hypothetical protein